MWVWVDTNYVEGHCRDAGSSSFRALGALAGSLASGGCAACAMAGCSAATGFALRTPGAPTPIATRMPAPSLKALSKAVAMMAQRAAAR